MAKVLTRCGASNGVVYFFPGALVPREQAGWKKDGMSTGDIQLITNGNELDIVYTDGTGGTKSARADGFEVVGVPQVEPNFLLVILISLSTAVMEHYLFSQKALGMLFGEQCELVQYSLRAHFMRPVVQARSGT